MLITTLMMSFAMSQGAMAKVKKTKYLGHNYQGEVNDQKVPAGKGVMNVGGLIIEGIFSDHSASNAMVSRAEGLGTNNTTFMGEITYDESENITLKAGGIFMVKYYLSDRMDLSNPEIAEETLNKDRVVNSNSFEKKEAIIPFVINQYEWYEGLYIPRMKGHFTVGLRNIPIRQNVSADLFVVDGGREVSIQNYKDSKGRVWNYKGILNNVLAHPVNFTDISVTYPNGSNIAISSHYQKDDVSWEIRYPNGKFVKSSLKNTGDPVYDMGKIKIRYNITHQAIQIVGTFIENVNREKFSIPYTPNYSMTSDSIDLSKLSNSEMENLIQEYIDTRDLAITTPDGKYENGIYTTNKQAAAANAKEKAESEAVLNKSIAEFKKQYGFNPDRGIQDIIKVGRKVQSVVDARNRWLDKMKSYRSRIYLKLEIDHGNSKCYNFYTGLSYQGYFWETNGVITSVGWN